MIPSPDAVLYDTKGGKLLYVYGADTPKAKLVVDLDLQTKRPKRTLNAINTPIKV